MIAINAMRDTEAKTVKGHQGHTDQSGVRENGKKHRLAGEMISIRQPSELKVGFK